MRAAAHGPRVAIAIAVLSAVALSACGASSTAGSERRRDREEAEWEREGRESPERRAEEAANGEFDAKIAPPAPTQRFTGRAAAAASFSGDLRDVANITPVKKLRAEAMIPSMIPGGGAKADPLVRNAPVAPAPLAVAPAPLTTGDGLDFGAGMGSPYSVIEGPGVGDLIVAGAFTDGTDDSPMATWNPDDEWALVPGFTGDDGVEGVKLLRDGPELYLAGYFGEWDGTTVNGIARWDFTDFYPVGTGLTYSDGTYGAVYSLALYDGLLFAFGEFDKAGSVAAAGSAYYGPAVEPGAPRSVKATATTGAATVTWAAPLSNGGVPITQYVVTAAPGGRTCTATAPTRTCTVTGLTAGSTYRFTVTAKNSIGTGPASAASAAVTIPKASSAVYRTISTRVLFYPGDSRVGPKGAAALAALKARIPAGAKVTWVKVTGYVQGTTSRFSSNDSMLAMARATSAATWLKKHAVGGGYTVGSGGVSGTTGLDRAAVVAIRYVVPAA